MWFQSGTAMISFFIRARRESVILQRGLIFIVFVLIVICDGHINLVGLWRLAFSPAGHGAIKPGHGLLVVFGLGRIHVIPLC
ncbi:hypothetical protein D3C80_1634250 [compost metagenome]